MKEIVKRDLILKTDPETNEQYWAPGLKTVIKPDENDRLNAVLDILKGTTTAEEVRRQYDITSINSVYTWIGKYVSQEKSLSLEEQTEEDMTKKSKDDQIRELKSQLVSSSASDGKVTKNPRHALRCQGILLNLPSENDTETQAISSLCCKANQFTKSNL